MKKSRILYLKDLENLISYKFKSIKLLDRALSHSSYINEQSKILVNNERLEFLGDSILNLIITDFLVKYYPKLNEGKLSKIRSKLVSEIQLYTIANSIGLGHFIRFGKGEIYTGGRKKISILANTFEAVIASIYLDTGIKSSSFFIKKFFLKYLKAIESNCKIHTDYKSYLQEKSQQLYKKVPKYSIIKEKGPSHKKKFEVKILINNIISYGEGKTKKLAEQKAAQKILFILNKNNKELV